MSFLKKFIGQKTSELPPIDKSKLSFKDRMILAVATVGPCGYAPIGRGTCGSIAGMVCFILFAHYYALSFYQCFYSRHFLDFFFYLVFAAMLLLLVLLSVWIAGRAEKLFGQKDDQRIVIDEFAGIWVALSPLAISGESFNEAALFAVPWLFYLVAFRLLDTFKPWPCSWAASLPGGLGIVADDIVAGIYGSIAGMLLCVGYVYLLFYLAGG